MVVGKTSTLTLRIDPALKKALRSAAERDHRSIANMVEVLIRDHCHAKRIPITEQGLEVRPVERRHGGKVGRPR